MIEQHMSDLRQQIAALQTERAELLALPRDRATVEAIIRQTVEHWQRDGEQHVAREIARTAAGGPHALLVSRGVVPATHGAPAPFDLALGPLLTALLGADHVEAALLRYVESVPAGMPAAERETRLAEIAKTLDAIEAEEEKSIMLAAGEGISIARRPNARPEIVVGVLA
ncbi:MAG TPA: hypothetical protein VGE10_05370 [Zeimonas sp.]